LLEIRDAFMEEGEGLLVGDVAASAVVQDLLGIFIDCVGVVVGVMMVGHGGLQGGVPDLLHDVGADLFMVGGEGHEEGSGGVELSFADEVLQITGG
jgi:hypothetical protein